MLGNICTTTLTHFWIWYVTHRFLVTSLVRDILNLFLSCATFGHSQRVTKKQHFAGWPSEPGSTTPLRPRRPCLQKPVFSEQNPSQQPSGRMWWPSCHWEVAESDGYCLAGLCPVETVLWPCDMDTFFPKFWTSKLLDLQHGRDMLAHSHPMSFLFASWASKTSRAVCPNELSCSGLPRLGDGNHPNAFWILHAQLQRHYHPSNTSHTPILKDVNTDHRCGLTNSCQPLSKREASSSEAVAPHWDFLPLPREKKRWFHSLKCCLMSKSCSDLNSLLPVTSAFSFFRSWIVVAKWIVRARRRPTVTTKLLPNAPDNRSLVWTQNS